MINYGKQLINEDDIQAVVDVLRSDSLTQGPTFLNFESEVAQKVGASEAVAVNSATSALHIACLSLGLGEGDVLWTSPNSFVASSNCAIYCRAAIDFVDIDPFTFNMSVEKLEAKLIKAALNGKLPKIVVPVHMCGQSCDMAKIKDLSNKYEFFIIEDASHAMGGKYKNSYIGSCLYSDIVVFSFHPAKIITTGEGGMALTNNHEIANKMRLFRSHGVTRNSEEFSVPMRDNGPWYYEQIVLGFNYKMSDIQAALGISQLKRLDHFVAKRNQISKQYNAGFRKSMSVKLPLISDECVSSFHLYVLQIDFSESLSKIEFFNKMKEVGINLNCHYIPIHTQPYYKQLGFKVGDFPVSEAYYKKTVTLPVHPSLTEENVKFIVDTVKEILS